MKINNFRGELTDISAKKEAIMLMCATHGQKECASALVARGNGISVAILAGEHIVLL